MHPALLSLSLLVAPVTTQADVPAHGDVRVLTDSAAHTVTVDYVVSGATPVGPHHHGDDRATAELPAVHADHLRAVARFTWPVDGWVRGVRVEVVGADGEMMSPRMLHHVNLLNYDRRQLVHPAIERLFAAGQETGPLLLPKSIGVPVTRGMQLGVLAAYSPQELLAGSTIRLVLDWTPANQVPRPVTTIPVLIDVDFVPGESPAYDLPPGPSIKTFEFTMATRGRVLGVGGHMHDYGVELTLDDVETGRRVFTVATVRDEHGTVLRIPQVIYGAAGRGRELFEGRRYRLTAYYDNPTGRTLPEGAMGEMVLLFAPHDQSYHLAVDPKVPEIAVDLEGLAAFERGTR